MIRQMMKMEDFYNFMDDKYCFHAFRIQTC